MSKHSILTQRSMAIIRFHNLSDQNLKRHEALASVVLPHYSPLVSDSIRIRSLLRLFIRSNQPYCFHFLELYNISFRALVSEIFFRFRQAKITYSVVLVFFLDYGYLFARLVIFKLILRPSDLMIVSSELRKNFLENQNIRNRIVVVRNKPLADCSGGEYSERSNNIVLVGNLNNRSDFLRAQSFAKEHRLLIHCYCIGRADIDWIRIQNFENVVLLPPVSYTEVSRILMRAKFALCTYTNESHNQLFSASSKLFEILYFGCVPIVSDNPGVLFELKQLKYNYVLISDLEKVNPYQITLNKAFDDSLCFESELEAFEK